MADKIKICLLTIIAALLAAVLWQMQYLPHVEECAGCGAHVTEFWYTQNYSGGLVHICQRCADNIDDNID